ncbi:MAG: ISKra4 family transposase [Terriglobia bacterium]
MKVKVQVVIESESGEPEAVEEVAVLDRGALRTEDLGLTLAEAKDLLRGLQQTIVTHQVNQHVAEHSACSACARPLRRKGKHTISFRTLFGKLTLESPRYYACACQKRPERLSLSPLAELLKERSAPELSYLEAKFVSLSPYGVTAALLAELLPIGSSISTASLHRNLERVAARLESELGEEKGQFIEGCPRDWEQLPPPNPPLTVGLDGGYVHAKDQPSRTEGWFEVIAGKSVPAEGPARRFAFVNKYDTKRRRRLFEVLKSQGLQMNQQVVFLSDGGETVRDLQSYLSPESEHWLDWFHITMRLTVMGQMLKGAATEIPTKAVEDQDDETPNGEDIQEVEKNLDSLKWNLWHGNVYRALQVVDRLEFDLETIAEYSESAKKLLRTLYEFGQYIKANRVFIPNFGDRYRHGEAISTAFVESTINQVVSKRMVKRQQMRWSQRGAHLLLQVRTRALDGVLRDDFVRWHPGMKPVAGAQADQCRNAA